MKRHYVDKKTGLPAKFLTVGESGNKSYDVVFRCDHCKAEIVSGIEYWRYKWYAKPTKMKKRKKKSGLLLGWAIREEIGIVVCNPEAIESIEFIQKRTT